MTPRELAIQALRMPETPRYATGRITEVGAFPLVGAIAAGVAALAKAIGPTVGFVGASMVVSEIYGDDVPEGYPEPDERFVWVGMVLSNSEEAQKRLTGTLAKQAEVLTGATMELVMDPASPTWKCVIAVGVHQKEMLALVAKQAAQAGKQPEPMNTTVSDRWGNIIDKTETPKLPATAAGFQVSKTQFTVAVLIAVAGLLTLYVMR